MRKLVLLVAVTVACAGNPGPSVGGSAGGGLTGANDARGAVTMFLNAVAAQDLQAMSVVWGTEKGAARDNLDRDELDKRLILIQSCYRHDTFTIAEETAGGAGHRLIRVAITRGRETKTPNFDLVQGPSSRWYVQDADFNTMRSMCA